MDLKSKLTKENISRTRQQLTQPAESIVEDPTNSILDTTTDFLLEHEGFEPSIYKDTSDIDTVGVGANISSPATQKAAEQLNLNTEQMRASQSKLTPEQGRMLARKTLEVKYPEFKTIRSRDFPEAKLAPNSEAALLSMYYNNPKLLGPILRSKLASNDMTGAAKEIMLRSNKDKVPGITKRRLAEAQLFLGDQFEPTITNLTPEEKQEIHAILSSIENPHEKAKVLEQYGKYLR